MNSLNKPFLLKDEWERHWERKQELSGNKTQEHKHFETHWKQSFEEN